MTRDHRAPAFGRNSKKLIDQDAAAFRILTGDRRRPGGCT